MTAAGAPPARHAAGLCPRCGVAFDAEQEYCLECGLRLPWESPLFAKLTARAAAGGATRVPRDWVWPALIALVVAAAGAAVAIVVSRDEPAPGEAIAVATGGVRPLLPDTAEVVTAPQPAAATGAKKAAAAKTPVRRAGLARWPRGRDGWTNVLVSIPQSRGGPPARARANEAVRRGLREVGVIDSNRFASLHPGYYVVFAGIYASPEEAASALRRAKAVFPLAYTREIAS
jgi:hypothetical protein